MTTRCAGDIEGPWVAPSWDSGLIERCRKYWYVPVNELPDVMVATYLNQDIARPLMIEEARKRMAGGKRDGSELYDGQLKESVERVGQVTRDS